VISKILARIILEKIKKPLEQNLRQNQAGFRARKAWIDHTAALHILIEQSLEWNASLFLNFIDYRQAFDSVNRQVLWKLLPYYGLPHKIIQLIKILYDDFTVRITHNGQMSIPVLPTTGVRQGCTLSPTLFLTLMDWIVRRSVDRKKGIRLNPFEHLEDLEYADDIYLMSNKYEHLQAKTESLNITSKL
jgi:hypothetical protein